jgi:hypothetical protein
MALSVDYVYKFALGLIRKNQSAGLIRTDFQFFWNDAQASYMDDLVGRFQGRSNTKEGANTGLIQDETIIAKLTPFMIPVTIPVVGGQAIKPTDFIYTLAMRVGIYKVYQIDKDEIQDVLGSVITPPSISKNKYYFTEYGNYYKLYPAEVTSIDVDYIQTPPDIVWNFSFDANNNEVYNSVGSVDPKWSNNSCREITKRMLKVIGVSFADQDFEGFGQSVQTTGE